MPNHTRRELLKSAGSLAAASAGLVASEKKKRRASGFAPANVPRKLTENLYLFEDTCNV
jgi:hypothetical protein